MDCGCRVENPILCGDEKIRCGFCREAYMDALQTHEGQVYTNKKGTLVRVKEKKLVSKKVIVESLATGNIIELEGNYPLQEVDETEIKKEVIKMTKTKTPKKTSSVEKKPTASSIIFPMMKEKKYTSEQIAKAVISKIGKYKLDYLAKQIRTARLAYARAHKMDVALLDVSGEEEKVTPETPVSTSTSSPAGAVSKTEPA